MPRPGPFGPFDCPRLLISGVGVYTAGTSDIKRMVCRIVRGYGKTTDNFGGILCVHRRPVCTAVRAFKDTGPGCRVNCPVSREIRGYGNAGDTQAGIPDFRGGPALAAVFSL